LAHVVTGGWVLRLHYGVVEVAWVSAAASLVAEFFDFNLLTADGDVSETLFLGLNHGNDLIKGVMFDLYTFFMLGSHFLVEGKALLLKTSLHLVSLLLRLGHLVLCTLGADLTVLDLGRGCYHVAVVLIMVNSLLFLHLF